MMQDITERKHIQDALLAAKTEAEAANRAKSEFLAAMSHDLRTPLNAILGFAEILSHQYFGPISDKYREYAEDIQSSGKHLLMLVNEILDLSSIETGKKFLVKEKLSTMEIVRECTIIVGEKAYCGGIELVTKVPKDLPFLWADKRASKQILLNLLSNAIKFTPQGGKITVSAKASKRNTTLKIANTGKGIPAEKLPKLTDPFNRTDTDPYLAEQGWGLGLTITKALVDLHDGKLDIKSKVGKGTTITVTFPNSAL
jgi:signal transduction histidine kinase